MIPPNLKSSEYSEGSTENNVTGKKPIRSNNTEHETGYESLLALFLVIGIPDIFVYMRKTEYKSCNQYTNQRRNSKRCRYE